MIDRDTELLFYRAEDALRRGVVTDGHFLNAGEQYHLSRYLDRCGYGGKYFFFGGCPGTERNMLFFVHEYLHDFLESSPEYIRDAMADDLSLAVGAVKVKGSGYKKLSHRDFMGSILGLGVERFVIGDIVVLEEEASAIVFCGRRMADFLVSELISVGADRGVVTEHFILPENYEIKRSFRTVTDTVASERLDCVVAALINCSRDSAKVLIASGEAEKNYSENKKADSPVSEGDIITVRGHGKYIIRNISDKTKKNRIRLVADKYV
ncbi:MAG: hypothetical protein IKT70_04680 [Clostridia bacterium]|nr:hypothetical protein [Clostridia bacterium]